MALKSCAGKKSRIVQMFRWLRTWFQSQYEEAIRLKTEELDRLRRESERLNEAAWQEFGDEPFELSEKEYRRIMKHRSRLGSARFNELSNLEFDIDPDNPRMVRHKPPSSGRTSK